MKTPKLMVRIQLRVLDEKYLRSENYSNLRRMRLWVVFLLTVSKCKRKFEKLLDLKTFH